MSPKSEQEHSFRPEAREFVQNRARRTYERLLAAAEEEFSIHGFDGTQTPDIAARAKVSVGTFYRYFDDKKQILLEVFKADLTRGREEVLAGMTPERLGADSRRQTIDSALRVLLEIYQQKPRLQRLFLEMSVRDDEVARLRLFYEEEACDRIASLIAGVCSPEEVADPKATAYVVLTSVVECANAISGARGELSTESSRLMSALSEMVYRTIFGGSIKGSSTP